MATKTKKQPVQQAKEITLKDLRYNVNLNEAHYEIDCLQNRLLEMYLRADPRFRRAFATNYTGDFYKFLQDKARLREPVHIAVIGQTRSGKSYTTMAIATFIMACYGKTFNINYVCANAYEFLEKLKSFPEDKLINSCFVIDEEKQAVYGVGSIAKKIKITDVQHIIAMNNISTIMLNPSTWANKEAFYGLRIFGRCFKTKTTRSMLYNLQERGKGGELPMGCVYLPIFTTFLPEPFASKLEKDYIAKKQSWIRQEMRGENDVLYEFKKKSAFEFSKDKKFQEIKSKDQKVAYISLKMGSEYTKGEIDEIYQLTKLIENDVIS